MSTSYGNRLVKPRIRTVADVVALRKTQEAMFAALAANSRVLDIAKKVY